MVTDSATRSARGRSPHLAVPATETQSPRSPTLPELLQEPDLSFQRRQAPTGTDRPPRAQTGPHGHKATKEVHVHSSWRGER